MRAPLSAYTNREVAAMLTALRGGELGAAGLREPDLAHIGPARVEQIRSWYTGPPDEPTTAPVDKRRSILHAHRPTATIRHQEILTRCDLRQQASTWRVRPHMPRAKGWLVIATRAPTSPIARPEVLPADLDLLAEATAGRLIVHHTLHLTLPAAGLAVMDLLESVDHLRILRRARLNQPGGTREYVSPRRGFPLLPDEPWPLAAESESSA